MRAHQQGIEPCENTTKMAHYRSPEVRTWACAAAEAKNILNLCHSCDLMMRGKFSHLHISKSFGSNFSRLFGRENRTIHD